MNFLILLTLTHFSYRSLFLPNKILNNNKEFLSLLPLIFSPSKDCKLRKEERCLHFHKFILSV